MRPWIAVLAVACLLVGFGVVYFYGREPATVTITTTAP